MEVSGIHERGTGEEEFITPLKKTTGHKVQKQTDLFVKFRTQKAEKQKGPRPVTVVKTVTRVLFIKDHGKCIIVIIIITNYKYK